MIIQSPFLAVVESINEALDTKQKRPSSRFISGGTEVIADQNLGLLEPEGYISLRRIKELHTIEPKSDGLYIGAGVVVAQLLDDKAMAQVILLKKAARAFGTRQVRNRATVGGNIASGLPDRTLLPCLLALEATVHLQSAKGKRSLPIKDFLIEPGKTAISKDEILTGTTVPYVKGFQEYYMVGPRNAQFFVTACLALVVDEANKNVRLGLGNAGPTAMRAKEAEEYANNAIDWKKQTVDETIAIKFGEIAAENCSPVSDAAASAAYRRHAIKVMSKRILLRAFERKQ